jgi:hypothetical protein
MRNLNTEVARRGRCRVFSDVENENKKDVYKKDTEKLYSKSEQITIPSPMD